MSESAGSGPGMLMSTYCYSLGLRRTRQRPPSLAFEEHIGQLATVHRTLLLWYVGREQWPINFIYSHPRRERQGIKLVRSPRNAPLVTEPRDPLAQAPSSRGMVGSTNARVVERLNWDETLGIGTFCPNTHLSGHPTTAP